ncbi:MAG: triose-phosphate isomerase [Deltaproteobacteria bacterium]|nr:triose-phosphate isomerase [Deltaproteobacteria bacterium]
MRTKLVAGNWKLHKTVAEARALVEELSVRLRGLGGRRAEVAVMPPFTALWAVREACSAAGLQLGAQDVHWEEQGAFTGEVSAKMLRDVGCQYVIVGHSERRAMFGDTPENVGKKAAAVLGAGLVPIICVGETLAERERGETMAVVRAQLEAAVAPVTAGDAPTIVIAYEPVWAIGTGKNAETYQAQEVHEHIRGLLRSAFGEGVTDAIRILYGGSVKPSNAGDLMSAPDIDGALVGGASLSADSFAGIVAAAENRP